MIPGVRAERTLALGALLAACGDGRDGPVTQPEVCAAYVDCTVDVVPDGLAAALAAYGADGTCWADPSVAAICEEACRSMLVQLIVEHPDAGACALPATEIGTSLTIAGEEVELPHALVKLYDLAAGTWKVELTDREHSCEEAMAMTFPSERPATLVQFAESSVAGRYLGATTYPSSGDHTSYQAEFALRQEPTWDTHAADGPFEGTLTVLGDDVQGALRFSAEACVYPQ